MTLDEIKDINAQSLAIAQEVLEVFAKLVDEKLEGKSHVLFLEVLERLLHLTMAQFVEASRDVTDDRTIKFVLNRAQDEAFKAADFYRESKRGKNDS